MQNKKEEAKGKKEKAEKTSLRQKALQSAKKLKIETRKSAVTAITAAFAFLIALAWRDVISEFVENITKLSPIQGKIISAVLITIIAVVGIMIVSRYAVKE